MLKLSLVETVDWILNDAWATIILVAVISLAVVCVAFLSYYSFRELRRVNDVFAIILLCETEVELPKSVAFDALSSAFHSKISEHFAIDIYNGEKEDWVKLFVRENDGKAGEGEGLIATATEENYLKVLLTYLL